MVPIRNLQSNISNFRSSSLILAILLLLVGCDSGKQSDIPAELVGTWRTQHPKYDGLYIQIDKDRFAFSTAEGTVENYQISKFEKLESSRKSKRSTHVIYGRKDGQELKLTLDYEPIEGGIVRFKNQQKIPWFRDNNPSQ